MAVVSCFARSAETRPPITEQNPQSQGSTKKIFQRMCCHIGSVSPRPRNLTSLGQTSILSRTAVSASTKTKKVVVYQSDIYGSFYDAVSKHRFAGDWRYYKDKPDHAWGGNWRTGAGILRLSFLNAARNIGRRGLSQRKEELFFVLFNSGRIQSSRYVRGGCK